MRQQQLDAYRAALILLREELEELEIVSRENAETVELDQSKVGRLSRVDALQAQQMAKETSRRRQLQLVKIAAALQRMDAGEYGYCVKCEEEISMGRLDFDPASTRCIGCMED